MIMTESDIEIRKFINDFGFCEISQIEKRFQLNRPRNYKIMQRLVKADFVMHQRVFNNNFGIFYLSNIGAQFN